MILRVWVAGYCFFGGSRPVGQVSCFCMPGLGVLQEELFSARDLYLMKRIRHTDRPIRFSNVRCHPAFADVNTSPSHNPSFRPLRYDAAVLPGLISALRYVSANFPNLSILHSVYGNQAMPHHGFAQNMR
jgi:hypothetical protein